MIPNRVPMDRDTPSPEPLLYLFIHSCIVCWSPQKTYLLHAGKDIKSSSTDPHADVRRTYNGSPRGYDRRNWAGGRGETMPFQYFLYLKIVFLALS